MAKMIGFACHCFYHGWGYKACHAEPCEHIRTFHCFGKSAFGRVGRKLLLEFIHPFCAPFVNYADAVDKGDVLAFNANVHVVTGTGNGSGTSTALCVSQCQNTERLKGDV